MLILAFSAGETSKPCNNGGSKSKIANLSLVDQRDVLERQMDDIIARQCLNELCSDYKNLTNIISESLELLHTGKVAHEIPSMPRTLKETVTADTQRAMDINRVFSVPFAMVDEIADSSPVAEDGL
ncbi:hypothetical protein GIB67_007097 [Kingdonia uniflora]|uniref:Uncharacterized protein n=1 Tax=Kingdonia uniflora TaxID=39325 RepID=A0A7J7MLL5_9MAGN|nr:hypothetical protein GIB67_007097 [Kingdonia uniflora]